MMESDALPAYQPLKEDGFAPGAQNVQTHMYPLVPQQASAPISTTTTSVAMMMPGVPIACGPKGQSMICPNCRSAIKTKTLAKTSTKTHRTVLMLMALCCWPCACLPYCMDSCRNINHYCPNCDTFIGTYQN